MLAVNIEEDRQTVAAWVARNRLSVPVLLDPDGAVTRGWQVSGTPTVFVLGRGGRLLGKAVGTRPWSSPVGRSLLEALLAS